MGLESKSLNIQASQLAMIDLINQNFKLVPELTDPKL